MPVDINDALILQPHTLSSSRSSDPGTNNISFAQVWLLQGSHIGAGDMKGTLEKSVGSHHSPVSRYLQLFVLHGVSLRIFRYQS